MGDMLKNVIVECANSRIKKFILNSWKYNFKLEQWWVEVKSIERMVKRLKLEDNFLVFLDLECENDQWNEEDVYGNEINRSNASKILMKIENLWSMVQKWF